MKIFKKVLLMLGMMLFMQVASFASEADLAIPDLHNGATICITRQYYSI